MTHSVDNVDDLQTPIQKAYVRSPKTPSINTSNNVEATFDFNCCLLLPGKSR